MQAPRECSCTKYEPDFEEGKAQGSRSEYQQSMVRWERDGGFLTFSQIQGKHYVRVSAHFDTGSCVMQFSGTGACKLNMKSLARGSSLGGGSLEGTKKQVMHRRAMRILKVTLGHFVYLGASSRMKVSFRGHKRMDPPFESTGSSHFWGTAMTHFASAA